MVRDYESLFIHLGKEYNRKLEGLIKETEEYLLSIMKGKGIKCVTFNDGDFHVTSEYDDEGDVFIHALIISKDEKELRLLGSINDRFPEFITNKFNEIGVEDIDIRKLFSDPEEHVEELGVGDREEVVDILDLIMDVEIVMSYGRLIRNEGVNLYTLLLNTLNKLK